METPDLTQWQKPFELCQQGNFEQLFEIYDILNSQELVISGYHPFDYLCPDNFKPGTKTHLKLYRPIHYAAAHGNVVAVQSLVEKYGCSFDGYTNSNGSERHATTKSPLHIACYFGHYDAFCYIHDNLSCKFDYVCALALTSGAGCTTTRYDNYSLDEFCHFGNVKGKDHFKILKSKISHFTGKKGIISAFELALLHGDFDDICDINKFAPIDMKLSTENLIQTSLFSVLLCHGDCKLLEKVLMTFKISVNSQYIAAALDLYSAPKELRDNIDIFFLLFSHCKNPMFVQYHGEYVFFPLLYCLFSYDDDFIIIKQLIQNYGSEVDSNGQNLLHHVCAKLESHVALPIAKILLRFYPYLQNEIDKNLQLPLHIACNAGHSMELIDLVSKNCDCDMDSFDKYGNTPLHIACMKKNRELVEFLVHYRILSVTIKHYFTIIFETFGDALFFTNYNFCKIDLGNVSAIYVNGNTLLHYACMRLNQKLIVHLIEDLHASINIINFDGDLPIHILFKHYHWWDHISLKIAESLCSKINICISNKNGDTLLHILCKNKEIVYFEHFCQLLEFLVHHLNASLEVPDKDKNLPLHLLASGLLNLPYSYSSWSPSDVFELVCSIDVINTQNSIGNTVLHIVCESIFQENIIIPFLVKEKHASASIINKKGDLPVHSYLKHAVDISTLDLLLHNTDVNIPNSDGNTPLHLACLNCSENVIIFLVKSKGAMTSLLNKDNELPLHLLLKRSPQSLYALNLLITEANLSVQDIHGNTPLHIAYDNHEKHSFLFRPREVYKQFDKFSSLMLMQIVVDLSFLMPNTSLNKVLSFVRMREVSFDLILKKNSENISPLQILLNIGCGSSVGALFTLDYQKYIKVLCSDLCLTKLVLHSGCSSAQNRTFLCSLANSHNVCVRDSEGKTVLHYVCQNPSSVLDDISIDAVDRNDTIEDIVKFLLEQNDSVIKVKDNIGNTPLHYCAYNGYIYNSLKERICKEDLLTHNKEDLLPIHVAIKENKIEVAEYLLTQHVSMGLCVKQILEVLLSVMSRINKSIDQLDMKCQGLILQDLAHTKSLQNGGCRVRHSYSKLCNEPYNPERKCCMMCSSKLSTIARQFLVKHSEICDKRLGTCPAEDNFVESMLECLPKDMHSCECCNNDCYKDLVKCIRNEDKVFLKLYECKAGDHFNELTNEMKSLQITIGSELTVSDRCAKCMFILSDYKARTSRLLKGHRLRCLNFSDCAVKNSIVQFEDRLQCLICETDYFLSQYKFCQEKFNMNISLLKQFGDLSISSSTDACDVLLKVVCQVSVCESRRYITGDTKIRYPSHEFSLKHSPFEEIDRHKLINAAAWYNRTDLLHYLFKDEHVDPSDVNIQPLSFACGYSSLYYDYVSLDFGLNFKRMPSKSTIALLLAAGCSIFCKCSTSLHNLFKEVCCERDLSILKALISNCNVIKSQDSNGNDPLMTLIISQFEVNQENKAFLYDAMKYLIHDCACDQTHTNLENKTAFQLACEKKLPIHMLKLFTHNLSQMSANYRITMFETAVCNEVYDIAGLLMKSDNATIVFSHFEQRHLVSKFIDHAHELNIDKIFLQCKSAIDCSGNTLFHKVCEYSRLESVKILIKYNQERGTVLDLDSRNDVGDTPLHICCKQKDSSLLLFMFSSEYLGNKEKALCSKNIKGEYPLSIALKSFTDCPLPIEMLKSLFLLTNLTTENVQQKEDLNEVLHLVCNYSAAYSCKIFKHLKEQGASLVFHDNCGKSALHHAAGKSLELVMLSNLPELINDQDCEGNTPLHIACANGKENIITYLLNVANIDPNKTNKNKETPLHKFCSSDSTDTEIFKLLLSKMKSFSPDRCKNYPLHVLCKNFTDLKVSLVDLCVQYLCDKGQSYTISLGNEFMELPLHFLCKSQMTKAVEAIELLLPHTQDVNYQTIGGDTPLILACMADRQDIVLLLAKDERCNISQEHTGGEMPLHLACNFLFKVSVGIDGKTNLQESSSCYMNVLQSLSNSASINATNSDGDTPLHVFLRNDFFDGSAYQFVSFEGIVETYNKILLLLFDLGCYSSLDICNNRGEYPIHLACQYQYISTIDIVDMPNKLTLTNNGDNILHCACKFQDRSVEEIDQIIKLLDNSSDLHEKNHYDELPIHLCCNLHILKALVDKGCDINSKNKDGNTPLHLAAAFSYGNHEIIIDLIVQHNFDIFATNSAGESFLDIIANHRSISLAEKILALYLKNTTMLKKVLSNSSKKFLLLLYLSSNEDILQLLLNHKVDPSVLYLAHSKFLSDPVEPPQIPVTILFIGDAMTGKTTLINSLKREAGIEVSEQEPQRTAGVVSNSITSKKYGYITAYDFAGQREYYASHDAVMESILRQTPPIVVLNVKLTESEEQIKGKVSYWSNFIKNRLEKICNNNNNNKSCLIIIFSYADAVDNPDIISTNVCKLITSKVLESVFHSVDHICMDCRDHTSDSMCELVGLLKTLTKPLKSKGYMKFNAHCLFVFLKQQWNDKAAIHIEELMTKVKQIENKKNYFGRHQQVRFLPSNLSDMVNLCEELAQSHSIMLIKDKFILQRSWIVLKKNVLLKEVSKKIFASSVNITQNLSGTGVVCFSILRETFSNLDPNMIISFLQAIEYCYEILDDYVMQELFKLEDKVTNEKYYFFPHLVTTERVSPVWSNCESKSVEFGWILHCKETDNHFTPRFVHILLLRLIFGETSTFAPIIPNKDVRSLSKIWKSGLLWLDEFGVECIVDVIDTFSKVIVFMRCEPESKSRLFELRASTMKLICKLSKEMCPAVLTEQFFVHPSGIEESLEISEYSLISMSSLCRAIVNRAPNVVTSNGLLKTKEFTLVNLNRCTSTLSQFKSGNNEIPVDFWASLAEMFKGKNYIQCCVKFPCELVVPLQ